MIEGIFIGDKMYKYFHYENRHIIIDYLDNLLPGLNLYGFFDPLNTDGDIAYVRYKFSYVDSKLNYVEFDLMIVDDCLIILNIDKRNNSLEFSKFTENLDLINMGNYLKSHIRNYKISKLGIN